MSAFVDAVSSRKDDKGSKDGKDKKHGKGTAKFDDVAATSAIAEQIAKLRRPGGLEVEAHAIARPAEKPTHEH